MVTIYNARKIASREKSVENAAMRLERIGVERRVSQLLLLFLPSATSAISRRPFNWTTALDSLPPLCKMAHGLNPLPLRQVQKELPF